MRVLHIVPQLFDATDGVVGGAERYVLELARAMSRRVETTLLSFGRASRTYQEGALRIHVIGSPYLVRGQANNPLSLRALPELLRADVIHCHQEHILMSSLSALIGRSARKKVFVSDLGGGGWDISSYLSTKRWFNGHLHISEYSRKISGLTLGSRAHVIMGGVDTEKFSPDAAMLKDLEFIFVGRLLPHKGVDRVVEALQPSMKLDLFGSPYHPEYLKRLRDAAVGKDVTFHFGTADVQLIRAYQRARCVVLPSLYEDCYGNRTLVPELLGQTLLEGMACGLPAICTNVASMPEVVADGETGLVVSPEDPDALTRALQHIHENPERAAEMGRRARQRVLQLFTWTSVVERCLSAYSA